MLPIADLALFAAAATAMVLTPGPNMIYLVSRSICQGRRAGVVSLAGVIAGFVVHMLAAAAGLTTVFMAVPLAYQVLRWAGALYLVWMAWQAIRPGARSPFEAQALAPDSPARLFTMGFATNLLNPKIAIFYLAILPQFVRPGHGSILAQSLQFGMTQIAVSFTVNLGIVLSAAGVSVWFSRRPGWRSAQRYIMASVLGGLALRLLLEPRKVP